MFKGKVPTTATVEQYFDVVKTTFNYEISSKKFVAVVDFNTTSKTGKIIEMSPVQENVVAVTVETKEVNGQTITTSNSIQEIKTANSNTESVLTTITTQYPLLKKQNVTQVKVIESSLSDTFEVTYTDSKTNISTTITTNSDKEGQTITIENIDTKESVTQNIIKSTETQKIEITKEEYTSNSVQELVSFVDTTVSIHNITKITAELSPNFVTYNLEVISNGKSFDVTVIERDSVKEVVAVRTTS